MKPLKSSIHISIAAIMVFCCLGMSPSTQTAGTPPADDHPNPALPWGQMAQAAKIQIDHWMRLHPTAAGWWNRIVQEWRLQVLQHRIVSLENTNSQLKTRLGGLEVILIGDRYGRDIFSRPITEVARRHYSQALAKAGRDFEGELREVLSQARERKDTKAIRVLEGIFQRLSTSSQRPHGQFRVDRSAAPMVTKKMTWKGHRYGVIHGHTTWRNAESTCQRLGGHLVTITSSEEQAVVAHMADGITSSWIGATCEGHVGKWRWVTGEPWHYSYWRPGEPNDFGGIELFAEMSFHGNDHGRWNDIHFWANTRSPSAFICEWETP